MPPQPTTQADAFAALWPWLVLIVGGPAGILASIKAVAAFRDWLKDTRAKVDAVPDSIARAAAETLRFAREAHATGMEARAATELVKDDVNKLGTKVNRIDTQQLRDHDRMTRIETDHERLAREFHDSEKALPEILKNERHAIPDSPTGRLVASLDERVENLKEDHGRRIGRLEDVRGKGHDA
jgi:chromosome segregation ATPase